MCSERARLMQSCKRSVRWEGPALPGAEPRQGPCRAESSRSIRRPRLEEASGSRAARGARLSLGPGWSSRVRGKRAAGCSRGESWPRCEMRRLVGLAVGSVQEQRRAKRSWEVVSLLRVSARCSPRSSWEGLAASVPLSAEREGAVLLRRLVRR